jgi:hypothetical protein
MSSRRRSNTETVPPSDWLAPHRQRFLSSLAEHGYTRGTLRTYGDAASVLCREVLGRRLLPGELCGRALVKARASALDQMHANKPVYKRFCLDRFIDALVVAGVAERPEPPRRAPTALARLRSEFDIYMREQRGLAEKTIYASLSFYDRFMAFQFGAKLGPLDDITPADSVAFLREVRGGRRRTGTRRRRRICAACSASCSGAARPSAIWLPACHAWPHRKRLCCRDRCCRRRSSD